MQILDRILSTQIFYRVSENIVCDLETYLFFSLTPFDLFSFSTLLQIPIRRSWKFKLKKVFGVLFVVLPAFPPFLHRTIPDRQFFWQLLIQGWLFCSKNKIDGGYLRALNPEDVERHTRRGMKRSISVDLMIIQVAFCSFGFLPSVYLHQMISRRTHIFFLL